MFDYHIHTHYCNHATGTMEEYVQAAISKNLTEMGFSCHIPYEFMPIEVPRKEYGMSLETLNAFYFPEIQRLKNQYKDYISIKSGLEIDYFGWIQDPINRFIDEYSCQLDYIIGSVHILNSNGIIWGVDDHRFSRYFNEIGIDNVYNQYLDAIMDLIQTNKYHILAHLDLPKKYGFKPTDKNCYYRKIEEILNKVKQRGMCIEISTGGLRKYVGEIYPDEKIIRMMVKEHISLVTSSDSHKPEEVGYNFPQLYSYLKQLGVKYLYKYTNGQKIPIKIDRTNE